MIARNEDDSRTNEDEENGEAISSPDATAPASPPDPSVEIAQRLARYPAGHARETVERALADFARARKTGRIQAGPLLAFLRWCDAYPAQRVVAGLEVYIDKDYAGDGKKESYAEGIIRNLSPRDGKSNGNGGSHLRKPEPPPPPPGLCRHTREQRTGTDVDNTGRVFCIDCQGTVPTTSAANAPKEEACLKS